MADGVSLNNSEQRCFFDNANHECVCDPALIKEQNLTESCSIISDNNSHDNYSDDESIDYGKYLKWSAVATSAKLLGTAAFLYWRKRKREQLEDAQKSKGAEDVQSLNNSSSEIPQESIAVRDEPMREDLFEECSSLDDRRSSNLLDVSDSEATNYSTDPLMSVENENTFDNLKFSSQFMEDELHGFSIPVSRDVMLDPFEGLSNEFHERVEVFLQEYLVMQVDMVFSEEGLFFDDEMDKDIDWLLNEKTNQLFVIQDHEIRFAIKQFALKWWSKAPKVERELLCERNNRKNLGYEVHIYAGNVIMRIPRFLFRFAENTWFKEYVAFRSAELENRDGVLNSYDSSNLSLERMQRELSSFKTMLNNLEEMVEGKNILGEALYEDMPETLLREVRQFMSYEVEIYRDTLSFVEQKEFDAAVTELLRTTSGTYRGQYMAMDQETRIQEARIQVLTDRMAVMHWLALTPEAKAKIADNQGSSEEVIEFKYKDYDLKIPLDVFRTADLNLLKEYIKFQRDIETRLKVIHSESMDPSYLEAIIKSHDGDVLIGEYEIAYRLLRQIQSELNSQLYTILEIFERMGPESRRELKFDLVTSSFGVLEKTLTVYQVGFFEERKAYYFDEIKALDIAGVIPDVVLEQEAYLRAMYEIQTQGIITRVAKNDLADEKNEVYRNRDLTYLYFRYGKSYNGYLMQAETKHIKEVVETNLTILDEFFKYDTLFVDQVARVFLEVIKDESFVSVMYQESNLKIRRRFVRELTISLSNSIFVEEYVDANGNLSKEGFNLILKKAGSNVLSETSIKVPRVKENLLDEAIIREFAKELGSEEARMFVEDNKGFIEEQRETWEDRMSFIERISYAKEGAHPFARFLVESVKSDVMYRDNSADVQRRDRDEEEKRARKREGRVK